jgi:hypothetical protein
MFLEDQMVAWENRPAADQTWTNLQTYFTEKWLERCQYLAALARQSCFKEAALAAQEQAAATEEEEMQAMMFALLQEQHQLQLKLMAAANKATMEAMMERIKALVAAQGGRKSPADKENTPPLTNGDKKNKTSNQGAPDANRPSAPTARRSYITRLTSAMSLSQTRTRDGWGGSRSRRRRLDRDWGHKQ